MTASALATVLLASVVGSLHCAGMCGPFVAVYSTGAEGRGRRWMPHFGYHAARLVAYASLGASAGMLGAALDLAGSAAGVGKMAGVVAGSVMVLWALAVLLRHVGILRFGAGGNGPLRRRLVTLLGGLSQKPPLVRAALLGLSSALLPCGWLYAFAVLAAGAGSALGGAAVMLAFWLGTLPLLVGLGVGVSALAPRLKRHVPVLSAVALMVVGLWAVVGRYNVPSLAAHGARAAVDHAKPSCH